MVVEGLRTEIEENRRHLDFVAGGLRTEIRAVAERGEEIKRSLGVMSETLRTDIRTVAEGLTSVDERFSLEFKTAREELNEVRVMMRFSFSELDRRIQAR